MDEKIKRICNWMDGKNDYPITIELNPTNICNSNCLSCWLREFKPEKQELSKEKMLKIVREAASLGIKEFRIPGSGEPLVKEGIMDVLKEIKKNNMYGLLITNSTLLDEDKIKQLVDMEWDCITSSMDGPDAETHDYLRGLKGCFKKVVINLDLLKSIKNKEKKEKPIVRFNVVLSNKNFNRIYEIFQLAAKYDCKDIQIQSMTIWGQEGEKLRLNKKQMKEFQKNIDKIKEFAEKKGIITNIDSYKKDKLIEKTDRMDEVIEGDQTENNKWLNLPCLEPWYNIIILPDGTVAPCSISGGKDGDSIKDKNLRDVWFGKNFNMLRNNLLQNKLPDYCKKCCVAVHIENKRIKEELKICIEKQKKKQ